MRSFVAMALVALLGLGGVALAQGIVIQKEKPLGGKKAEKKEEKKAEKKAESHEGTFAFSGDWESLPPDVKKRILEEMKKHLSGEELKEALEQLAGKSGSAVIVGTPEMKTGQIIIMKLGDKKPEWKVEKDVLPNVRAWIGRWMKGDHPMPPCGRLFRARPRARQGEGLRESIEALRREIAGLRNDIRGLAHPPRAMGGKTLGLPKGGGVVLGPHPPKPAAPKPNTEVAELKKQVADLKAEVGHLKGMMEEILRRLEK